MAGIAIQSPLSTHEGLLIRSDISKRAFISKSTIKSQSAFSLNIRGPISQTDQEILALIQSAPQKASTTAMEKCCVYQNALTIYQAFSSDRHPFELGLYLPDRSVRRQVYQLVFDALYHREVLKTLLNESSFYSRNFNLHSEEALLHIMLFDFQESKFTLKPQFDRNSASEVEKIANIADALWKHRVKLNATLARMRVESDALRISQLIPDPRARDIYEASCLYPCYARVNPIKVRDVQVEVVRQLLNDGIKLVNTQNELHKHSKSMCLLQKNLLIFSSSCRRLLDVHMLVENGCLALQDITSYRFVEGIREQIEVCAGDIVVTECNSGAEVAHIATILGYRGSVIVFNTPFINTEELSNRLCTLEVTNVKFMEMPFERASYDNAVLGDVQMMVCLSLTTQHVVGHLVDCALQQVSDHMLPTFLQPPSRTCSRSIDTRTFHSTLTSALTFHQLENIFLEVYKDSFNSVSNCEATVRQTMQEYNEKAEKIGIKLFCISSKIHFSNDSTKFFTIMLQREPDKPPTPPRDVIDRAIAKGIIDGEGISGPGGNNTVLRKQVLKGSKGKRRVKSPFNTRSQGIPMTLAAQQKVVNKKQTSPKKIFRV